MEWSHEAVIAGIAASHIALNSAIRLEDSASPGAVTMSMNKEAREQRTAYAARS